MNMNALLYYLCVSFFVSAAESSPDVPLSVRLVPEHTINVRSTPSLDPAEELLEKFGSDNQMNLTQMEELFRNIGVSGWNDIGGEGDKKKKEETCFSSRYFYGMYSKNDGNVNRTDLIDLCPAVLYQLSNKECQKMRGEKIKDRSDGKEDPTRAWGFGFVFVTIISLGSLLGACVVPFMEKKIYQKILMCMVSLAVGVLGGSGVFHLIPSALGYPHDDGDYGYLWKCSMIIAGLYLFFVLESVMKLLIQFKTIEKNRKKIAANGIIEPEEKHENIQNNSTELSDVFNVYSNDSHGHSHNGAEIHISGLANKDIENGGPEPPIVDVNPVTKKPKQKIATVAWMIIIGDGLHNFIDGLAIGASFSSSVVSGISTSLAVLSEELPHELGDFAILLNSGFTYKQAMVANFLSACSCFIGLVIGLILGYATSAVKYIYGIAGGMFLYISLVDMLPEAVGMANALGGNSKSMRIKMMLLQNFAIVFGFSVMLVLAIYAPSIQI